MQCPDCRVPFVVEDQPTAALTPEQLRLLASQILGSWQFWAALMIIIGGAAWGIVAIANRVIDARSKSYLETLEQQATNHIGAAFGQISNQINAEFRQPRIKAAIEQAARDRANELFTNGIRPSLEAFQDVVDMASAQFIRSSNALVALDADVRAAQSRISAMTVTSAPPVAQVIQATPSQAPKTPPASASTTQIKLAYVTRNVTQAGSNYVLTVFFRKASGPANGMVEMVAGTYNQTAKVLSFAAMSSLPSLPPTVNETADAADLKFSVTDREPPTVMLEFSGPTIVRLTSDALDTDLTIPIAAEKMQLPSASK